MRTVFNFLYLLHLRFSHNFSVLIRSHELSAFWLLRENFTGHLCKLRKQEDKRFCKWLLKFLRTHSHSRCAMSIQAKVQRTSTQHGQDYPFRENIMAEDEDKVILQIHSALSHWLPQECRWTLATALGREIPLGNFHLILTLITQIGFQTMTSSYHLVDLFNSLRSI